jgi:hypothetical protein
MLCAAAKLARRLLGDISKAASGGPICRHDPDLAGIYARWV